MNFDKLKDFQILIVGIVLAVALIIVAQIVNSTFSNKGVTATGSANKVVTSDNATWKIEVSAREATKSLAYAKVKSSIPVVLQYLKENKITDNDIEIATPDSYAIYAINPKNGNSTNEISYYNFSQVITVNSKDVKKIQEMSSDIQKLLDKGINIESRAPEYYYSDIANLKIELLEMATKDAKNRANAMLKSTHNRVSNIKSVKMGVFQITPKTSTEVADWGINDTSTIEKKVTAVANVVFEVK